MSDDKPTWFKAWPSAKPGIIAVDPARKEPEPPPPPKREYTVTRSTRAMPERKR